MIISECSLNRGALYRELDQHGTVLFPLSCYEEDLTREAVGWHWHDDFELVLTAQGAAAVRVGSESFALDAGEGVFINSGALHELSPSGPVCRIRSLVFSPRLIGGVDSIFYQRYALPLLSGAARFVRLGADTDWQRGVLELAGAAWDACAREEPGYELDARCRLSRLVFELLGHTAAVPPSEKAARDARRAKTMLQFIQEHCAEPISAADIARSASISESECLRCFRSVLGTTPMGYVRQLRLQCAAEMLSSTQEKISRIAAQCGFEDMSYFSRAFRRWSGRSPAEYRAGHAAAAVD